MMRTFFSSIAAGWLVGIGGVAYLSCDSRYVGALLFAFGLFAICTFGFDLYTGKIGYVLESSSAALWRKNGVIWLGNLAGAVSFGLLINAAKPELLDAARALCTAKLSQSFIKTLVLSAMCGIIIYAAVDAYKKQPGSTSRYLGILLGIPLFILCGFEHSIADMFYFALSVRSLSDLPRVAGFLLLVSVGNAIGSLLFNLCQRFKDGKPIKAEGSDAAATEHTPS